MEQQGRTDREGIGIRIEQEFGKDVLEQVLKLERDQLNEFTTWQTPSQPLQDKIDTVIGQDDGLKTLREQFASTDGAISDGLGMGMALARAYLLKNHDKDMARQDFIDTTKLYIGVMKDSIAPTGEILELIYMFSANNDGNSAIGSLLGGYGGGLLKEIKDKTLPTDERDMAVRLGVMYAVATNLTAEYTRMDMTKK